MRLGGRQCRVRRSDDGPGPSGPAAVKCDSELAAAALAAAGGRNSRPSVLLRSHFKSDWMLSGGAACASAAAFEDSKQSFKLADSGPQRGQPHPHHEGRLRADATLGGLGLRPTASRSRAAGPGKLVLRRDSQQRGGAQAGWPWLAESPAEFRPRIKTLFLCAVQAYFKIQPHNWA